MWRHLGAIKHAAALTGQELVRLAFAEDCQQHHGFSHELLEMFAVCGIRFVAKRG